VGPICTFSQVASADDSCRTRRGAAMVDRCVDVVKCWRRRRSSCGMLWCCESRRADLIYPDGQEGCLAVSRRVEIIVGMRRWRCGLDESGAWRCVVVDTYMHQVNTATAFLAAAHYVWDPLTATVTSIDMDILRQTSPGWTLCARKSLSQRSVERCCSGPFAS
jgi:hypothetical protein